MSLPLHRRTLLKCILAVAASAPFGCSDNSTDPPPEENRSFFPQSVASGDPRPDSVVLWTRAVDPDNAGATLTLSLQVAQDAGFQNLVLALDGLTPSAEHDSILKVKVTGLAPRTDYYYRFLVVQGSGTVSSPTGRTRTAPVASSVDPVRFAVANCQDFAGRYYNAWQRMVQLDEDLDFVLFHGDYIYEIPGSVPTGLEGRAVTFSDPGSTLPVTLLGRSLQAANSLSNYRDLYRRYRSDAFLQQAHERYPFIVTWDDHEYSDDCWGDHATYTDGRLNEEYLERRRNAELAYFEYMPLDVPPGADAGPIDVGAAPRFPDTRIWRDFEFGRTLKLNVLDYRTKRPSHLIPGDGYPGTVVMDAAALQQVGATADFATDVFAYVNIDDPQYGSQKSALRDAYQVLAIAQGLGLADASARAAQKVQGNLAVTYVNEVLGPLGQPTIDPAGKPRGLAWIHLGKRTLFSRVGSRYIVIQPTFDVYAAWCYATTQKSCQDALGAEQEASLRQSVTSPNTWHMVASSVSLTRMIWDLSGKADITDVSLRNRYYFDVDQWDGFPTKKRELLEDLRTLAGGNVLFLCGDIHASFASVEEGVPILTAPAISSSTVLSEAAEAVSGAGFPSGSPVYRYTVTLQEQTLRESNPGIAFVNADANGYTVVEARPDEALATFQLIPSDQVTVNYADQPEALAPHFTRRAFVIRQGTITETTPP
ncbi:alkaline phosphatase D family protein [Pyxidicoccus parkwayensis]|uniref:Alkaline phosphatase D family protein n=1 Tax=Pyxidicoccus parkwayensis TaxID=2813578 RepID=A0ABX7P8C2_9BACT|nr:alkaline phosphatase D family protein [Pyxidicoccus parkwaysis]QSQ26707.1 alkaline phosphatase D family protein [Pyxidicoccus parkwaysis]